MPSRSYYTEPRARDYLAFTEAFFPDEREEAMAFIEKTSRPFISDVRHLAAHIGISQSLIRQILHKKQYHYRIFSVPKPGGGERIISTPKTYLKVIQWWILDHVLVSAPVHEAVHGFRKGRSFVSNAMQHFGAFHLLNVDIQQFFPSIKFDMVVSVFKSLGYGENGSKILAEITTLRKEAPTGAPTSPMVGNVLLNEFDGLVAESSITRGINYTRYADDLTFSSSAPIDHSFLQEISDLVQRFGFKLNMSKTKFMGRGDRMDVTGLVINDKINLPRQWRNCCRGFFH